MAFIPTPDGARCVVAFGEGSMAWSNVFHFQKAGFTELDMQALADALDEYFGVTWTAGRPDAIAYRSVTVYDIRTSDGPLVIANTYAGVGSQQSQPLPINLALVVTLRTASRGRSARGRVYLSGWDVGNVQDGHFTPDKVAEAEDIIQQVITLSAAEGWTLCVRSTRQDGQELATAVMRPVISHEVRSPEVGTQRRRIDRP